MTTATEAAIDWRARTTPVEVGELTPTMLAPIRRDADETRLPQTAWPSRFYGPDFHGLDCLVVGACALLGRRPHDAAPTAAGGLLTVLPTGWFGTGEAR